MNTTIHSNNTSISRILYGNAIFSGIGGLLFTIASRQIAALLGLDAQAIILTIGLVMLGYALFLFVNVTRHNIDRNLVLFTVICDTTWVVLSILLLVTGLVPLTAEGKWAVAITAMVVDVFATLQFLEWRRM